MARQAPPAAKSPLPTPDAGPRTIPSPWRKLFSARGARRVALFVAGLVCALFGGVAALFLWGLVRELLNPAAATKDWEAAWFIPTFMAQGAAMAALAVVGAESLARAFGRRLFRPMSWRRFLHGYGLLLLGLCFVGWYLPRRALDDARWTCAVVGAGLVGYGARRTSTALCTLAAALVVALAWAAWRIQGAPQAAILEDSARWFVNAGSASLVTGSFRLRKQIALATAVRRRPHSAHGHRRLALVVETLRRHRRMATGAVLFGIAAILAGASYWQSTAW